MPSMIYYSLVHFNSLSPLMNVCDTKYWRVVLVKCGAKSPRVSTPSKHTTFRLLQLLRLMLPLPTLKRKLPITSQP